MSVICIKEDGTIQVKSTAGNNHLGGEDFNTRMVDYFVDEFREKHKKDLTTNKRALHLLRTACEKVKCSISSSEVAIIKIDSLYEGIDYHTRYICSAALSFPF